MARLASLIALAAGAAIAFSIGWILGYVLAPMDEPTTPGDDVALRKRLEHFHPDQPHAVPTPPVWTADVMRRRGEQV